MSIGSWLATRIYSKVSKYNSVVKMSLQAKSEFTYDFGVLYRSKMGEKTLVLLSNCLQTRKIRFKRHKKLLTGLCISS